MSSRPKNNESLADEDPFGPREKAKSAGHPILKMLQDKDVPLSHRARVLHEVIQNSGFEAQQIVEGLLGRLENSQEACEETKREVEQLLTEMKEGPKRSAVVIARIGNNDTRTVNVLAALEDGATVYAVVPEAELADSLKVGERIILDSKARAVLGRGEHVALGEVGTIERVLDDNHLLVSTRGGEQSVYLVASTLGEQIRQSVVGAGAKVIVNPRQLVAIAAVPHEEGLSHYRFLYRGAVPDVVVDRDIGAPPRCIEEIADHVLMEMLHPEKMRRYKMRRCMTKLLCGVSGSGKSLAIRAIHRRMYEIMSEATGMPLDKLPPRVIRVRQSQVLSQWLGESEKNWDRVMDEAEQLADEEYKTRDGRSLRLPVLVVIEEIDGFGRARGHEAIYDRILTTLLERLDPNRQELSQRLIIFIATTNTPHLVDSALFRRIGGSIEHFGRLGRRSFSAVLEKHVRGLPAASRNGYAQSAIWRRNVDSLTNWLFSPNSPDPGLVEVSLAGSTAPLVRYRRDFLTGALVDRAVQQAAMVACRAELDGVEPAGITLGQLARAFDNQLRGIVEQLNQDNIGSYTDLPEGARVVSVRKIPQPDHLSFEFERE